MFIPNPEDKPCVDHINTVRDDNRVENLRWSTYKENSNNELTREHFSESLSIKIVQLTLEGEFIKVWQGSREAEKLRGFNNSTIIKCCKGELLQHHGYKWMYYEDYINNYWFYCI